MSDFSPTSVQLKSEINGECSCKRHQRQHLEFSTTLFGDQEVGGSNPLAPTNLIPITASNYAAFAG
jgi:hypothetical protein